MTSRQITHLLVVRGKDSTVLAHVPAVQKNKKSIGRLAASIFRLEGKAEHIGIYEWDGSGIPCGVCVLVNRSDKEML